MQYKPNRQMTGVGVGGSFAIVLVWGLSQFGVNMPAEVGAASATLVAFVLGWLLKE